MAAIALSALGTGLEVDRARTAAERRRLLAAAALLLVLDAPALQRRRRTAERCAARARRVDVEKAETHHHTWLLTWPTICTTGVVPGCGQATVPGCYGGAQSIGQARLT